MVGTASRFIGGCLVVLALIAVLATASASGLGGSPSLDTGRSTALAHPAIVSVVTVDESGQEEQVGTGFLVSSTGIVVTAWPSLAGCSQAQIKLANGVAYRVSGFLGWEKKRRDFALLSVEGKGLPALPLGDGDRLKAGHRGVAIGTVTTGLKQQAREVVFSATRRLASGGNWVELASTLPTLASGSPVLDVQGEVEGMVLVLETRGHSRAFVVPVDDIKSALTAVGKVTPLAKAIYPGFRRSAQAEAYAGYCLLEVGLYEDALTALYQAVSMEPDFALPWVNIGWTHTRMRRWREALQPLERAARLKSGLTDRHTALLLLGRVYEELGRYQKALDTYEEALRLKPGYAEAHCGLAHTYSEIGQQQEAAESYREALRLDPKLATAYCGLGRLLEREERVDEASVELERAIEVDPSLAGAYYYLGYVQGELRQWPESVEAFRRAARLDPASATVRRGLMWAQAGMYGHGVFGFTLIFQRVGELDWEPAFGWLSTYQYGVLVWGSIILFPGFLAWRLDRPIRAGRRAYRRVVVWGFALWPVFLFWSLPHRCVLGSPAYYVALAPTSTLTLAWLFLGLGRIVLPAVRMERERSLLSEQEQPHREAAAEPGPALPQWTALPSPETEPVRLCRVEVPARAELIRAYLSQAGIPSASHSFGAITGYVLATTASGATDDYVLIFVPRNRLEEARRVVAELESGPVIWPEGMEPEEREKPG